jgi:hypothetical protein
MGSSFLTAYGESLGYDVMKSWGRLTTSNMYVFPLSRGLDHARRIPRWDSRAKDFGPAAVPSLLLTPGYRGIPSVWVTRLNAPRQMKISTSDYYS